MARKCKLCGEEGHNTRTCELTNEEKEYKELQKTLMKPTHIHISQELGKYKCGSKKEWWADKYVNDEFARKLPLCEECLKIWKEENPDKEIKIN